MYTISTQKRELLLNLCSLVSFCKGWSCPSRCSSSIYNDFPGPHLLTYTKVPTCPTWLVHSISLTFSIFPFTARYLPLSFLFEAWTNSSHSLTTSPLLLQPLSLLFGIGTLTAFGIISFPTQLPSHMFVDSRERTHQSFFQEEYMHQERHLGRKIWSQSNFLVLS